MQKMKSENNAPKKANTRIQSGIKPYELWKQNMVVSSDSIQLG